MVFYILVSRISHTIGKRKKKQIILIVWCHLMTYNMAIRAGSLEEVAHELQASEVWGASEQTRMGCTWISLYQPRPPEEREREKQGVVNFPIRFSSKGLILKPLMVTSPSPLCNWLSSHWRLHCTFPYLAPFHLWPPFQFTNSDSHPPFFLPLRRNSRLLDFQTSWKKAKLP